MARSRRCLLVIGGLALLFAAQARAEGKATLYRDTWGVPHIYADSLADAAYVLGYAQAEDRLEDIFKNIRTATGTMSEAFGEKYVDQDYILKMIKNAERCEEYWKTAPETIQKIGDSFMRGVEAYMKAHPDRKPEFAVELHGWQCAAIGRAMIMQWPLGVLKDDLDQKNNAPPFGSNAFAVAPSRCAEDCPILMTDPHLTWEGMAVFYEARVHAPEADLCGYFIAGSPLPALGHNAFVAWACTTGGPDTSDVYMVKLNPKNVCQYEYNGKWETFEPALIKIDVKGKPTVGRPALYTVYGPLLDLPDEKKGIAYTGATPYLDQMGVFEQMYKMALSKNCDEFYSALAMNQLMEQNILFADTQGNIQYVRNGRTPIRPEGNYNWSAPIPGGTDATRWLGIHKIEDLVQVKNPPQGYFQNCNVSPAVMMKDSPMTPDKYKKYIYNVTWDQTSPRGERLLELLDGDAKITKEAAMDYTLNVYDIIAKPWQKALKEAVDAAGAAKMADGEFAKVVGRILDWDGYITRETMVMPVVMFWRLKCGDIDTAAMKEGKSLPREQQVKLLDKLGEAIAEVKSRYGSLDVAWGTIHVIGRGGKYFPAPGADFETSKHNITETVFDVEAKEDKAADGRPTGKYIANCGSSTVMLSFLHKDGIESYSLVAWGESGNPDSPHYVDQSERLYSQRKFKPTWFKKENLLKNLESEKVLAIP